MIQEPKIIECVLVELVVVFEECVLVELVVVFEECVLVCW